MTAIIYFNVM